MIYAMLHGDLPPRALMGIDESSSVAQAKRALVEAYKEDPRKGVRLSVNGSQMSEDSHELARYGVQPDALIHAQWVDDGR
jgi:hypothetical protein